MPSSYFCSSSPLYHESLLNPICQGIGLFHQTTDISFKQTLFCFIWPALKGSYLVFSAYQFLRRGLGVMCFSNLIISDPDFHLHVGGLLNPIPGKLFTMMPSVLCSIPFEELLCAPELTGGYF